MPQYSIRITRKTETEKLFVGSASYQARDDCPKKTTILRGANPWEMFSVLSSWLHETEATYNQDARIIAARKANPTGKGNVF